MLQDCNFVPDLSRQLWSLPMKLQKLECRESIPKQVGFFFFSGDQMFILIKKKSTFYIFQPLNCEGFCAFLTDILSVKLINKQL